MASVLRAVRRRCAAAAHRRWSSSSAPSAPVPPDASAEGKRVVDNMRFFLLDRVLYPSTKMPLVIFEPRYRLMVDDALKSESKTFGFVSTSPPNPKARYLLETDWCGSEVGTVARIVHTEQIKGDQLQIEIEGTERFRVLRHDRNVFGLWEGAVELFGSDGAQPVGASADERDSAARVAGEALEALKRCFALRDELDLDDQWPLFTGNVIEDLDKLLAAHDMDEFSFRLASLLPVELEKHQRFLCTTSVGERLTQQLATLQEFLSKSHAAPAASSDAAAQPAAADAAGAAAAKDGSGDKDK